MPIQVIKEKPLAIKGELTAVARLVSFNTKQTGHVRQVELVFYTDERVKLNDLGTGWTLEDLANLHNMLLKFNQENL